jgi:hypothetical protein
VADLIRPLRVVATIPTRTPHDAELDLPPCRREWGPHICWTWTGWPHICRCLHCTSLEGGDGRG